jgi:cyclomaltodextrinase
VSFWAEVADRVRARHPDAYLMGEVIHGDYAEFVRAGHLESVTQYELWKAIWSSLNDDNFHELAHALGRHDELLDTFVPYTFVGNHDVTRIATQLDDTRHLRHALVVLTTVAGTPAIYAGDDHAFTGRKEDRPGGDDEVRPPFPDSPDQLSRLGLPTFHHHQQMLSVRRQHPWLHTARTRVSHVSNQQIVYESTSGENRLLVALSTADSAATVDAAGAREVLAGRAELIDAGGDGATIRIPPHGWCVLAC